MDAQNAPKRTITTLDNWHLWLKVVVKTEILLWKSRSWSKTLRSLSKKFFHIHFSLPLSKKQQGQKNTLSSSIRSVVWPKRLVFKCCVDFYNVLNTFKNYRSKNYRYSSSSRKKDKLLQQLLQTLFESNLTS